MRKYWLVPAVVLVALAIALFLGGWLQLSLAPDSYGVVFTSSHGFEETVVSHRGFSWRWERFIPGVFTLYRFPVTAQTADVSIKGTLPSADAYAALAPEKPDFSFDIRISALYSLKPEALPRLAGSNGLRPDGLGAWYMSRNDEMRAKGLAIALAAADRGPTTITDLAAGIKSSLASSFPELDFNSLTVTVARMPDLDLYEKMKESYLAVASAREQVLTASATRLAQEEGNQKLADLRTDHTLSVLTRYGELLDKYPPLLKFLFIVTAKNFSPQDLSNLDLLDKLETLQ